MSVDNVRCAIHEILHNNGFTVHYKIKFDTFNEKSIVDVVDSKTGRRMIVAFVQENDNVFLQQIAETMNIYSINRAILINDSDNEMLRRADAKYRIDFVSESDILSGKYAQEFSKEPK